MKNLFIVILLFSIAYSLTAADKLILKNGTTIEGVILSIDDEKVIIDRGISELSIKSSEVNSYFLEENLGDRDITSFGFTIGYPSGLCLTTAYSSNYFRARVTGGTVPQKVAGFHGILGYPIYSSEKSLFAPSFFIGSNIGFYKKEVLVFDYDLKKYIVEDDRTFSYYGMGIDAQFYGVTLLFGYGFEFGERVHGDKFIFEIGYQFTWY